MTASYFLPKKSGGFPLWRKGNPRRASPDAARMMRSCSRPLPDEGESALTLATRNLQPTLWETILPPAYERLARELAEVDALLDDPVFFEPYRAHFSALAGRPSIPIETYLRLMHLKYRYRLG